MGQPPSAILQLDAALKKNAHKPGSYRFSGIVGDRNHSFGYHLSPNDIRGWDYSLQTARDKAGAKKYPNYASAWDLSFGPSDMKLVTNRLLAACKRNDPRVKGIREFCGTLNGSQTYPWDHSTNKSEGINTWDSSHLWHVHISFYRDVCNDYNALKGVVDVICGIGTVPAQPAPKPVPTSTVYPLKGLDYFGDIKGGSHSRGGDPRYDSKAIIAAIKLLQQKLIKGGYAGKVSSGWADGRFEAPTVAAVKRFQKAKHLPQTGKVGRTVWNLLMKVK